MPLPGDLQKRSQAYWEQVSIVIHKKQQTVFLEEENGFSMPITVSCIFL